jgi:uncharacterized damage-inducible protein DinB
LIDTLELYEYAHKVRAKFASKLSEIPWDEVCKNKEASFYSMKNILLHMIDNEDWMVNWVIKGKQEQYVRKRWEEYSSMQMVIQHMQDVQRKVDDYLHNEGQRELQRKVVLKLNEREFTLSIEECLLQSFTEQLYHMGELIALLWQVNIEPPKMQWFWNNPREKSER